MRILFVCLGNICRSPLAEALFIHKINDRKLAGQFQAGSCGTSNYHIDEEPDPRTLRNASKNGIVISHRGRQLTTDDLLSFDMIIAMDKSNQRNIMRLDPGSAYTGKIHLMREFDPAGKGLDVPDPWPGTERDFQEVFGILDRSVDGLIDHLIRR